MTFSVSAPAVPLRISSQTVKLPFAASWTFRVTLHTTVPALYNSLTNQNVDLLPFTIKRCASVGLAIPPSRLSLESEIANAIPTSTDDLPVPTDFANAPNDVADLPACGVSAHCITGKRGYGSGDHVNRA